MMGNITKRLSEQTIWNSYLSIFLDSSSEFTNREHRKDADGSTWAGVWRSYRHTGKSLLERSPFDTLLLHLLIPFTLNGQPTTNGFPEDKSQPKKTLLPASRTGQPISSQEQQRITPLRFLTVWTQDDHCFCLPWFAVLITHLSNCRYVLR